MKKLILFLTVAFAGTFLLNATTIPTTSFTNTKTSLTMADNVCILYVKTSSGSAARSIKVTTDVSGGISCIGGRSFYTDSDGRVELRWVSGCYLKTVYVDGRSYEVDFKDGGSYTINMR